MLAARWQTIAWWAAIAGLTLLALGLRGAALDPPSLWLDDQWAALSIRAMRWSELLALRPPTPLGFVALERLVAQLSPDREWPLQLIPVAASAGQVLLAALLGERLSGRRAIGVLAAVLVVIDPLEAAFGARVKPYSTDALVMMALLYAGASLLEKWSTRRALAVAALGLAGVLLSFASIFAAPLLTLAALLAWRRRERPAWWLVAGFDVAVALLFVQLRTQSRGAMEQYWTRELMPHGSLADALAFFASQGWAAVSALLPSVLAPLLLLLPVGLFFLARAHRGLALMCGAIVLEAMLAAGLRLYPLGGGRTDSYLHPVLLVMVIAGAGGLASLRPVPRSAPLALAALLLLFARPSTYPECADAEVVARARSLAQPGDGLLIYPHMGFAAAYYGGWPSRFVAWPEFAHGFQAIVTREHTVTLPARDDYSLHPERLQPELDDFARTGPARVFYLVGGWPQAAAHRYIVERLTGAGYQVTAEYPSGTASLLVLEKRQP